MLGVRIDDGRAIMGRGLSGCCQFSPDVDAVVARHDLPALPEQPEANPFTFSSILSAAWMYLRNPILEDYNIEDKQVIMRGRSVGLTSAEQAVNFLGQRQRRLVGTGNVALNRPEKKRDWQSTRMSTASYRLHTTSRQGKPSSKG